VIEPLLKDEAFLADVDRTVRDRAAQLRLWWLGQSGFLLQRNGRHLLFDPYLSDSLTRKYEQTQKPHVRMTQIVVAPERLSFVDVVTSSHNHTDHLDAETLIPLLAAARHDVSILVPAANRLFAAKRLGLAPDQLLTLDAGQSIETKSFDITAVAAAHDKLETDETGAVPLSGICGAGRAMDGGITAGTRWFIRGWLRCCGRTALMLRFSRSTGRLGT